MSAQRHDARLRVLVCGSRSLRDGETRLAIRKRLEKLPSGSEVLHGGAQGADTMAAEAALELGLRSSCFPADWRRHGRRAGIVRNVEMLNAQPDLVLAYWDGESAGTAHTVAEARRRGIPVELSVSVPSCATARTWDELSDEERLVSFVVWDVRVRDLPSDVAEAARRVAGRTRLPRRPGTGYAAGSWRVSVIPRSGTEPVVDIWPLALGPCVAELAERAEDPYALLVQPALTEEQLADAHRELAQ